MFLVLPIFPIGIMLFNAFLAGCAVGSGMGSLQAMEREHTKLEEKGPSRVAPLLVPLMISNMAAGNVSPLFYTIPERSNIIANRGDCAHSCHYYSSFHIFTLSNLYREHTKLEEKGPSRVAPLLVPLMISNMAAGNVSIAYNLKGKSINVVTAPSIAAAAPAPSSAGEVI